MTVSRVPNVEGGIQPTIVTAKGDLITAVANANPARLGVGSDGQLLTADSTQATGLSYQNNFAAGKNKIINGDMRFNQRNFTSISGSADTYGFDRFKLVSSGGATWTPQTFTPGAAPVAGYEGVNFSRIVTSGQTGTTPYTVFVTTVEDVRILAGQSVTLSFWAKSASGTPKVALEIFQNFGTGGSPSSAVGTYVSQSTISTSWTRYSISFTIPSISGKTIGTTANTSCTVMQLWVSAGTDFNARTGSLGIQSNTFDLWGFQLEAGPVATAFQTATGTIQGELAACMRYCQMFNASEANGAFLRYGVGQNVDTTQTFTQIPLSPPMRVVPSLTTTGTAADYGVYSRNTVTACNSAPVLGGNSVSPKTLSVYATVASGLTQGNAMQLTSNNNTTSYLLLTAEL